MKDIYYKLFIIGFIVVYIGKIIQQDWEHVIILSILLGIILIISVLTLISKRI